MGRPYFDCSVSRVINAPISFVYGWCTDFREDDNRITGEKKRIAILERARNRFIMSVRYKSHGKAMHAARVVTLRPPYSWHLDWIGDEDNETGDYRLTRLGNRKTKLNVTFRVRNNIPTAPGSREWEKHANSVWDKYVSALERDYQKAIGRTVF